MEIFAQVEGPEIDAFCKSVASASNPFLFSKARPLPSASTLPKKKRQEWINNKGKKSWEEALSLGRVKPGTLTEWKEVFWGAAPYGRAKVAPSKNKAEFSFKSKGFPRPLFKFLSEENENLRIVLFGQNKESIYLATFEGGQETSFWEQDSSLKELSKIVSREKLGDLLQYRLRTSGKIIKGSIDALERGRRVSVLLKGGEKLSLQKESFVHPLRADMFLDEWAVLDDVLAPQIDGLYFYLDLYS